MSFHKFARWAAFLAMIVVCLLGIAQVQGRMIGLARTAQLTVDDPVRNAPPAVAFVTIALGGFRGLLADIVFLRSEAMKDDGNYFELVQLADWLVDLQPRFTGATAFLAWNMAYNVSVTFNDPQDRWRWVQRGIELIRDKALPDNPGDPVLFQQLGWIYQHKIGNILDDAHRYYKTQLALQVMQVLGTQNRYDWERLAAAPLDEQELRTQFDHEEAQVLDGALASRHLTLDQFEDQFRNKLLGQWPADLKQELEQAKTAKTSVFATMDDYLRSRWLRDRYKLDARLILPIIKQYGYLDFRLPEAHAIYWAKRGVEHATGGIDLQCERMINTSLVSAFKAGKIVYLPKDGLPIFGPNLAVAEAVRDQFKEAYKKLGNEQTYLAAYENFMKDAIGMLYTGGETKRAAAFLKELSSVFPQTPEYRVTVDEFGVRMIDKSINDRDPKQSEGIIDGFLITACQQQAFGQDDAARTAEYLACTMTTLYNERREAKGRIYGRVGLMDCHVRLRLIREFCGDPKNGMIPRELIPEFRSAVGLPPLLANGEAPAGTAAPGGVAPGLSITPDNGATSGSGAPRPPPR